MIDDCNMADQESGGGAYCGPHYELPPYPFEHFQHMTTLDLSLFMLQHPPQYTTSCPRHPCHMSNV